MGDEEYTFFLSLTTFCLCLWFLSETESIVIMQKLMETLWFTIQVYSKLVLSILLKMENMLNGHVHSVLQVKRFKKKLCFTILLYFENK